MAVTIVPDPRHEDVDRVTSHLATYDAKVGETAPWDKV